MSDNLPRVSEILRVLHDSYEGVPARILEVAAARGTALHALACQHFASRLDLCEPPLVPEEYRVPFSGLLDWEAARMIRPVLIEERSSAIKGYAYRGTPDLLCEYGERRILTLPDLKFTRELLPINRVQICAYWRLQDYQRARQAFLVRIDPLTGHWEEQRIAHSTEDWAAFVSALGVYTWRQAQKGVCV